MTIIEDPLKRLGVLVKQERMNAATDDGEPLNRSTGSVAIGISRSTLIKVEQAKGVLKEEKYAQIERFFKWPTGSIMRYLSEPDAPEPNRVEARREDEPVEDAHVLDDERESRRVGRVVAQWYRSAPLARRDHAWDLVMEFIESHPIGGAGD